MQMTSQQVQALYIAYFGRPADPAGLAFWTKADFGSADVAMDLLADEFAKTPEYVATTKDKDVSKIITDFYQNLFNRNPEPEGLAFWVEQIKNGNTNTQDVGLFISQAALNAKDVPGVVNTDKVAITSKVKAANQFTAAAALDPNAVYEGDTAINTGVEFLDPVTNPQTIPSATDTVTVVGGIGGGGGGTATNTESYSSSLTLSAFADLANNLGAQRWETAPTASGGTTNSNSILGTAFNAPNGGLLRENVQFVFNQTNQSVTGAASSVQALDNLVDGTTTDADSLTITGATATLANLLSTNIENINFTGIAVTGAATTLLDNGVAAGITATGAKNIVAAGTTTQNIVLEASGTGATSINVSGLTGTGSTTVNGGSGAGVAATFLGSALVDSYTGTAANETMTGGGSADQFITAGGTDVIADFGVGGVDKVDVTVGGSLTATVTADYTAAAAGDIDNQLANTLAVFNVSNDIDFNAANATGTTNGITISAAGNAAASSLTGTNKADRIFGGNAGDSLNGGVGNDQLSGGSGGDTLAGAAGNDAMTGGDGADQFASSGGGADTISDFGVGGVDKVDLAGEGSVTASVTADYTAANAGDIDNNGTAIGKMVFNVANDINFSALNATDTIRGITINMLAGTAANTIGGTDQADAITGNAGANAMTGGAGNDQFFTAGGSDAILDFGGADKVDVTVGGQLTATVTTDYTAAAAGDIDNQLANTLAVFNVNNDIDFVAANVTGSTNGITISAGTNAAGSILSGTNKADRIFGGNGGDALTGGGGDDQLSGGGGGDTITGGAGADNMIGGDGVDQFIADGGADTISDFGAGGVDKVDLTAGTVTATVVNSYTSNNAEDIDNQGAKTAMVFNVRNGVNFSAAAATNTTAGITISAAGNAAGSALTGTDQDDVITGGSGVDLITGGAGADAMTGGLGADQFIANGGADTIADFGAGGVDKVDLTAGTVVATVTTAYAATAAGDIDNQQANTSMTFNVNNGLNFNASLATGTTNGISITMAAGNTANTIVGTNKADRITGNAGANAMTGGAGADVFITTGGANTITDFGVGDTEDFVTISAGSTLAATVTGDFLAAGQEIDNDAAKADAVFTLNNGVDFNAAASTNTTGGITITAAGNANASTIVGTDQADVITGSTAGDSITGGPGDDIISLGIDTAVDTVFFGAHSALNGLDTITNFTVGPGGDVLDLGTSPNFLTYGGAFVALGAAANQSVANDAVYVINAGEAINAKDYGGADFGDIFAAGGKPINTTSFVNHNTLVVVQGTDETQLLYLSGGAGVFTAAQVVQVAVLDGVNNAVTFDNANFA